MGFIHKTKLEFLGAVRTVTGSRTKVTHDGFKMLVDCGLFQGPKELRQLNWDPIEGLKDLNAVFLTHAHVDHSGYLPKLVKDGYRGPIYCSEATADLCQIMLRDAAHIQEEDARYLGAKNLSEHRPPLPLYTTDNAELALSFFKPLPMDQWIEISDKVSVRLLRAGHILGATFVQLSLRLTNGVKIITFSGDLGNNDQYVVKGPQPIEETDYLIQEGTYGDRCIDRSHVFGRIEEIINKTYKKRGVLVIPAFAVGRTQELLHIITVLKEQKKIPDIKVYLDSPMANKATDLFNKYASELKPYLVDGKMVPPLKNTKYAAVRKLEDSIALTAQDGPIIIISASGMLSGGRILHHLKGRLPHPENTVLFVGYQADETKGRLLQSGLKKIRIHKKLVDVRASIETVEGLSAHADSDEILSWLSHFVKPPKKVFLNHGRLDALKALQYRLRTEMDLQSTIPLQDETFEL